MDDREKDLPMERLPDYFLSGKIICSLCRRNCRLEMNSDGFVQPRCEEAGLELQFPLICREDIAALAGKISGIEDLHLDFMYAALEKVCISKAGTSVTLCPLSGERRSELLRMQDYWLAQHSLRGEKQAQEMIVKKHERLLRGYIGFLGKKASLQRCDCEDLEQTVWMSAFRCLKNYNGNYRMWAWLKAIAFRAFLYQHSRRDREILSDDCVCLHMDARQMQHPSNIDVWISREYVKNLLAVLTAQERKIVVEHVLRQKSLTSLSSEMNLGIYRVRRMYQMALDKMRELILSVRELEADGKKMAADLSENADSDIPQVS